MSIAVAYFRSLQRSRGHSFACVWFFLLQVKVEGLSEAALIKSLSPRVMLSNHLLPKGTKMKVNLEDQGRQKVSFSFAQTKKPLQSLFGIPTSPDKSAGEPPSISSPSNTDKRGQVTEKKPELKLTPVVPESASETLSPSVVCPPTKLKTDLSKMHFKKQILSVSVTEENSASIGLEELNSSEVHDLQKPVSKSAAEFSLVHSQSSGSVCHPENSYTESPEAKTIPALQKPPASSGKDSESSTSAEGEILKRKTSSQSATALPGSESDGDTVPMSSSHKSADSSRKTSSESKNKEVKKSSINTHMEEKDKGSSKRSENHERSSSYSKSDRDSKHAYSRSSRLDKDRRRTRSRSRSRSRGSRPSSSHSRADRSRGDRGSRSERSYYHDSDRRSHRGSPRRDRRRSRSRTDRTRDSSDSEDDHRKARTRMSDSGRSSAYSSVYKDSKSSSYSKSEKACKSTDSPYLSEFDKRTQSSKSDRTSKRLSDSDSQRKCSPDLDSSYRKYSSHHKSETHRSSSSSTRSQTHEKHRKSSSSDSDAEHKGKSHISDRRLGSEESSQMRNSTADLKQMTPPRTSVQCSGPDRQLPNEFQSTDRANLCANAAESCTQLELETPDSQLTGSECNNETFKEKFSSTEKSYLPAMTNADCLNQVNVTLEIYNHSSEDQPYVNSSPAIFSSCSESLTYGLEKEVVTSLPGTASLDKEDTFIAHDIQQSFKPEIIELNIVSTVDVPHGTEVSLKSEPSCIESENRVMVKAQPMDTAKKSSGATKKSRWDIVGQVTSDGDNSQRTLCLEGKPAVKKVISVKEIELPHQQGSDNSQKDTETHSKQGKQTEIWKQEVLSEGRLSTKMHRELHEPPQGGDSSQSWGLSVFSKAHIDNRAATIRICKGHGDHEDIQDKLSQMDESAALSEATDSDNSEYDSDCGEVIKRLHSVVVVPKNSSLTIDMQGTMASQYTPFTSSEVQNTSIPAHMNTGEVLQQRLGNPAFVESGFTHIHMNDSSFNSMLCQSQSNMIDSTSHSEGSGSISAQAFMAGDIGVQGSIAGPTQRGITRQSEQESKQSDTVGRSEKLYSHYQPVHFSNADNIGSKIGFGLGWHFSQPEQPSSTYQQPDSSHGPHFPSTKMTGTFLQHQEHMQSTASWTHQSLDMQSSRQNFHHMHQQYQEMSNVVHPDSLTNDHDDFSSDKRAKTEIEGSGSIPQPLDPSSFVQGHEISSNSRGSIVSDPPRDEHFRPHRSRGPPKKRRPEVESESDNEAEAGPADKKERLGDTGISKETQLKTDAYRPSLSPQDFQDAVKWKEHSKSKKMPPYFDLIEENLYLTER